MADALITRKWSGDQGRFGELVAGSLRLYTGELPWRDNQHSISCIPAGKYRVIWFKSPTRGNWTYRLLNVPDRSGVLMHSGNYCGDVALGYRSHVEGCILLGEKMGWMDDQKAVLLSRPAVRRFEEYMQRKPFSLEVRDGDR